MNDKQYEAQHPAKFSPQAQILADNEILEAIYNIQLAISRLSRASDYRRDNVGEKWLIDEEKKYNALNDASYALFFTCCKLFKYASSHVMTQVNQIGLVDVQNVKKGVHFSIIKC